MELRHDRGQVDDASSALQGHDLRKLPAHEERTDLDRLDEGADRLETGKAGKRAKLHQPDVADRDVDRAVAALHPAGPIADLRLVADVEGVVLVVWQIG